jgi:8-oxo-dGTP diphosphatase
VEGAYRFCQRCGGTLTVRLVKTGDPERPVCDACGHIVYIDPKVAVGTIIKNERDAIALVRRAIEPGYGRWVFPGGYVDRGEELLVAAMREAREEANLEIEIDGLINLYSYAGATPVIIVYAARATGGELRADDECLDAAWFDPAHLPWDKLAFPSTHDALRDYLDGVLHPHSHGRG